MNQHLSQVTIGPLRGFGKLGLVGEDIATAPTILEFVLSTAIGVMSFIAFIWFTIQLVTGAIVLIGSGGDKGRLEEARGKITYGLIGIIVVIAAVFVVDLIGTILGIDTILSPADFIQTQITPVNP